MAEIFTGKPYKQIKFCSYILRYFPNKDSKELFWHRDTEDRYVWKIFGNVMIQLDNALPQRIKMFKSSYIPKETFHRVIADKPFFILIKGDDNV